MALRLYNTATRSIEDFHPLNRDIVTMYNCGPTVYSDVHIGNLRAYVFADILRRTLEMHAYEVKQVINITDVGHLVSDGDEGEDKMLIGANREGKSVKEIIAKYSDEFFVDCDALHIKRASAYPHATEHIPEQVALIETLSEKGFTYQTSDGIYFDTNKFPEYPEFARLDVKGMEAGMRVSMGEKKNSTDFALWKFSPTGTARREQEWDSPLGITQKGFPGWHIECSAMAMKYLGETIDIHTGGVDHIPVHHTNEIAQSECATGKQFARFWMHSAFMTIDGQKMSKSIGNTYRLADLHERGIPPLAFRYWLLTAHYRTQINFTWDALAGAQSAYNRLTNIVLEIEGAKGGTPNDLYMEKFTASMDDDLNTSNAVALIWKLTKDTDVTDADKLATIFKMDNVLGIGLADIKVHSSGEVISPEVQELLSRRIAAREQKDYASADVIRDQIAKLGYDVKDTPQGQHLTKI